MFNNVTINNQLEIIKNQINFNSQTIDIINIYNPPSNIIDYNECSQLISNNNTVLCGDFNAHNICGSPTPQIRQQRAAEKRCYQFLCEANIKAFQITRTKARQIIKHTKYSSWHEHLQ